MVSNLMTIYTFYTLKPQTGLGSQRCATFDKSTAVSLNGVRRKNRCSKGIRLSSGFTLLELSVVLAIVSILIGSLLGPISAHEKTRKIIAVKSQQNMIKDAVLGFMARTGYLPCPAAPNLNAGPGVAGVEARIGGPGSDCSFEHGYVPNVTLNIRGEYNSSQVFVDPWGTPYLYSLSGVNTFEYAKAVSVASTAPTFRVCSTNGCPAGSELASNVVAVILSLGPSGLQATASPDQLDNTDNDDEFVLHQPIEFGSDTEFDDAVHWISPNEVAFTLINAGRL